MMLTTALVGLVTAMSSNQTSWVSNEFGQTLLSSFESAPFPHSSRADGFKGKTKTFPKDPHYIDSTVGLFIPKAVKLGEAVNFVVHFHGHNNNVKDVFSQFGLEKQMADSGKNAVLVVPQGPKDAGDSGDGKLQFEPHGLENLLNETLRKLVSTGKAPANAKIGKVTLTAHSGGYLVTSAILAKKELTTQITDVILFDASYGGLEHFADWVAGDSKRRLISICTDHLGHNNAQIVALLQKRHFQPRVLLEADLTDAEVKRRGCLIVLTTELEHNDVVSKRNYFAKWVGGG